MPGPAPKSAGTRRRRNIPARGDWVELPSLTRPVLPPLPERESPWSARTRELWDGWRADPGSAMFGPSEVAQAIELAWLHDEWVRQGGARLAAEIRQRADGLGLTPRGKVALRWRAGAGVTLEDDEIGARLANVLELRRGRGA